MRPSSSHAAVVSGFLLGWIVAGFPGGAAAQNTPPASARQGAASPGKYRLGVWIQPVSQWNGKSWVPSGLRITGVSPGSPAERAGIQPGKVLTSVNGARVTSLQELLTALDNSGGQASLGLLEGRESTSRQVASFAWAPAPPVARSIPTTPTPYAAPSYGGNVATPGPRRVIQRPYYSNYGDAPSPNPFSTPPNYGNIVVP